MLEKRFFICEMNIADAERVLKLLIMLQIIYFKIWMQFHARVILIDDDAEWRLLLQRDINPFKCKVAFKASDKLAVNSYEIRSSACS